MDQFLGSTPLSLKLSEGVEKRGRYTTYLESPKAIEQWEAFKQWLLDANTQELTFEVQTRSGKPSATALGYMERDILQNGRFSDQNEREFLTACGFVPVPKKSASADIRP